MRVLGSLGAGTGSAHSWGFPVPSVPLPTQGPAGTGPARPVSPSRGWHTVRNPSRGSVTPPAVVSLLIPVGPRATPGTPTPLRHRSRASPCHPPRQATVTAARGGVGVPSRPRHAGNAPALRPGGSSKPLEGCFPRTCPSHEFPSARPIFQPLGCGFRCHPQTLLRTRHPGQHRPRAALLCPGDRSSSPGPQGPASRVPPRAPPLSQAR